ncbi:MAG: hypothetical protein J0H74_21010 [Chitinophagaceae bacterium]|nr:hypothetical protein [Chitinophagaceae bacterium]
MINYKLVVCLLLAGIQAVAQDPVSWQFNLRKKAGGLYELHMTASIERGWHIYSQMQPQGAIGFPIVVGWDKNPLLIMEGAVEESGVLIKHREPVLDSESWQYAGKVDLIQVVRMKAKVKTSLSGAIRFQVCTEQKCLPPASVDFRLWLP